jgi:hypothetical protein
MQAPRKHAHALRHRTALLYSSVNGWPILSASMHELGTTGVAPVLTFLRHLARYEAPELRSNAAISRQFIAGV